MNVRSFLLPAVCLTFLAPRPLTAQTTQSARQTRQLPE